MENRKDGKNEVENIINGWINNTSKIWQSMVNMNNVEQPESGGRKRTPFSNDIDFFEAWAPAMKAWHGIAKEMNGSDAMKNFINGDFNESQSYEKFFKTGWDMMSLFRERFNERFGYFDSLFDTITENHPGKGFFNIFNNVYENELSKIFAIPKLGPTRIHREKITRFMDKLGICMMVAGEFYYLLATPFEKAYRNIQDNLASFFNEKSSPSGFDDYYRLWIEELEKNFLSMFKTSEYTKVLGDLIDAVGDFDIARREIVKDVLKLHGIPAEGDLDELYGDMYALKKQVRMMEKKIARLELDLNPVK